MSTGSSTMNDLSGSQNFNHFAPPTTLTGAPINTFNPFASSGQLPAEASSFSNQNYYMNMMHSANLPGPSTGMLPGSAPMMSMPSPQSTTPTTPGFQSSFAVPTSPSCSSTSMSAGPIRKRRFSTAKIQPTRIKKVMQSDEEIGRMVASVPVAIGRAMEHFAEKFLMASAAAVVGLNGRTLMPSHMKLAIMANPHFGFLEPMFRDVGVPVKGVTDIPYNVCQVPPSLPASLSAMPPSIQSPSLPATNMSMHNMNIGGAPMSIPIMPFPPMSSPNPVPASFAVPIPGPAEMAMFGAAVMQNAGQNFPNPAASSAAVPSVSAAPVGARRASGAPKERPDLAPGEKPKRGRPRKVRKEEKLIDDELADVPTERELMPPPALPLIPRRNGSTIATPIGAAVVKRPSDGVVATPPADVFTAPPPPQEDVFIRPALQRQNSQDLGNVASSEIANN